MEPACRLLIEKNKTLILSKINLDKLRPYLKTSMLFTNAMLKDIYDSKSTDLFDELPSRGPQAFRKFIDVLKKCGYSSEATMLENGAPRNSKRFFYKMTSIPLGRCLIINNVNFEGHEERLGSEKDAMNLESIFKQMGFDVDVIHDLKSSEMENVLANLALSPSLIGVDSMVVIILSHGDRFDNEDVIYGTDGIFLKKETIYEYFNNKNCEGLLCKPKIFFFQACRGKKDDPGIIKSTITEVAEIAPNPKRCKESVDAVAVNFECAPHSNISISLGIESGQENMEFKPNRTITRHATCTDMLVVHSALPNLVSYRDDENGSWLCQDLISILGENYLIHDLDTMLKILSRKMQLRVSEKHRKQVLHVENIGLIGDIHFNKRECEKELEILDGRSGYFE